MCELHERRCGSGRIYPVAGFEHKATVGNERLAVTHDGAYERAGAYLAAHVRQTQAAQRAFRLDAELHYLSPALGKGVSLYKRRNLQQAV